jgi:hypothetical protein
MLSTAAPRQLRDESPQHSSLISGGFNAQPTARAFVLPSIECHVHRERLMSSEMTDNLAPVST